MLQTILVVLALTAAGFMLVRHLRRPSCGCGCSGCSTTTTKSCCQEKHGK